MLHIATALNVTSMNDITFSRQQGVLNIFFFKDSPCFDTLLYYCDRGRSVNFAPCRRSSRVSVVTATASVAAGHPIYKQWGLICLLKSVDKVPLTAPPRPERMCGSERCGHQRSGSANGAPPPRSQEDPADGLRRKRADIIKALWPDK